MNGRILSVALILLILFVACFVAGPVFSGEHPWDSDRGDDGNDGGEGDGDLFYDTIIVTPDTITVLGSSAGDGNDNVLSAWYSSWTSIWTGIWSAMSAAF